jgi:hypothetical protein
MVAFGGCFASLAMTMAAFGKMEIASALRASQWSDIDCEERSDEAISFSQQ